MTPGNEALVESWVLSLHSRRPKTVVVYVRELGRFAGWFDGELFEVTKRDVQRWVAHEKAQGLAQATIRARWIALRSFYGWAHDEGEIDVNPMVGVRVEKGNPPPPNVLSPADITALLKACEGTGFYERRDLALVRLFLSTGLRVSELAGLDLGDVDLPNRIAFVRDGKGGRSRVVKFDAATAAAVDRYKRVRARHRCARLSTLWIGHRGSMTAKGIPDVIRKRAIEAGIGHVHPHQMRHTWADRWLAAGGSEGDLQKLGGWESADIMRRYGSARAVDRALGAYDQIDPMGGL